MEDKIIINEVLYDKKPITWLIRELQKRIDEGYDYVEYDRDYEIGNTQEILKFSD